MEYREQDLKELKKDVMLVPEEESIRVQSVIKMKESIVKQRQAEEALLEQMLAEQKMVDELNVSLDENLMRTIELRKYNREIKEHMQNQVYRMNGLSTDKLEGMANYKKAYYIGGAFAIFVLSCVMVVLTGLAHGFTENICLFLSFYTALEGTVLITEARPNKLIRAIFRVIYFLIFPAMMVIFVCYELGYPEYELFLPYFCFAGLVIFAVAMISYFTYNPYNSDKQYIRKAQMQLKKIKKAAQKEVRNHHRAVQKEERRAERELLNEAEAGGSTDAGASADMDYEASSPDTDVKYGNSRLGADMKQGVNMQQSGLNEAAAGNSLEKVEPAPAAKIKTTRMVRLSKKMPDEEVAKPEETVKSNEVVNPVEKEKTEEVVNLVEKEKPQEVVNLVEKEKPQEVVNPVEPGKTEPEKEDVEVTEKRGQRGIVQWFRRNKA